MNRVELKEYLDEKAAYYEHPRFIETDPIRIPHSFTLKEDIEISGFLSATIAWGNRKSIINNATRLMELMGNSPYDFVMDHNEIQLERLSDFVHRTFNATDLKYFIYALNCIYREHDGLENVMTGQSESHDLQHCIGKFKQLFFSWEHPKRTEKHISDPLKNSAAKRINMFLRWMVRPPNKGVDFGIWKSVKPSQLSCPLDVHTGNVARSLKLLKRKQNDAKAVTDLDKALRSMDPVDPVKYDFALFGIGVHETFY